MTPFFKECCAATGLLLLFLTVIASAETLMRRNRLAAETARKTIHLAGGLGCLLFPLLVSSWVTVLCMASGFACILYFGESHHMLQSLSSVKRKSHGSLFFPVSILILFVLSKDRLWLYVSALLVLVLADSAAALAGTRFGHIFYQTARTEKKSLEGTLAFFAVGFLAVYLPLWLLSDIPLVTCLLTALLMALLLAGMEAVSIGGTDNLFVPLSTIFLLWKIPDKPQIEIIFQCLSLFGVSFLVVMANNRFKTLQVRPLIIFTLTTYAAWSLGSVDWMIPVLSGFMLYNRLCAPCGPRQPDPSARKLLRPMYPALLILFVANATLELSFWHGPFLAATATATSLCIIDRFLADPHHPGLDGWRLTATALLPGTMFLLLCLPIQGHVALSAMPVLVSLCAAVTLLYTGVARVYPWAIPWKYSVSLCAGVAAFLYAGIQHAGCVSALDPSTWREVFRCH